MNSQNENQNANKCDINNFQKEKIKHLNKFFMKNVLLASLISVLIFALSVATLIMIVNINNIDSGLKITLISITATFILTTSKTLIDKAIQIVTYLVVLLSEEQRGINKNLGIEIDKVAFEENVSDNDSINQ